MSYSVLMAVYRLDNPEWLREAIESILSQTVKTDDFVIVKDGPVTDELDEVLNFYQERYEFIRIISLEKNMGLGLALNRGVLECKNQLIARIDSDDMSEAIRMEKQLQMFRDNPNLAMVGTLAVEFSEDIKKPTGYAIFPETSLEIREYAKKRNPFCHPSMMLRKDKVMAVGNYQSCHLCEDYDLWVRMIQAGCEGYNIQEKLHYWRVSPDFYKRRSGIKYLKSILVFLKRQYENNFLNRGEYYRAVITRSIVYLMPNGLRSFVYRNFLRKKV